MLLSITVVRVLCCSQKMLQEIEAEETIGFFVTFLSLVVIQLGRPGPLGLFPLLATPLIRLKNSNNSMRIV